MRKQFGLSLVELMISITLGLILMTGVMKLFISSKVVFSTQQGLSRIQETGRLAIDFISHDISEAAYYGCHRPIPTDDNLKLQGSAAGSGLNTNFDTGIYGYDTATTITASLGPNPIFTAAKLNANVLVIRSAAQQGLILNAANTATALTAFTTATTDSSGCVSGICPDAVAVVADCNKSRVFKVSAVSAPTSNIVTVDHADSWGGSDQIMENFGPGAEILPFNTTIYYLAKSASGVGSSLWQVSNGGSDKAFELLEGVEQMRITYASAATPGIYQTASAITNWQNIWSVRVELLVRSIEDNILTDKQPYTFAGVLEESPTDRRLRQSFTVTTAIRSRMILN